MNLARMRKAIWAGVLAGAVAVPGAPGVDLVDGVDVGDVAAAAAAFVVAAILAGVAVYNVRNAGTANGSDPRPPASIPPPTIAGRMPPPPYLD